MLICTRSWSLCCIEPELILRQQCWASRFLQIKEPVGSGADWNAQIEKDLHRTFPGHPVMDRSGRRSLRRILSAYACRNPNVGYCQVQILPKIHSLYLSLPSRATVMLHSCLWSETILHSIYTSVSKVLFKFQTESKSCMLSNRQAKKADTLSVNILVP